MREKLYHQVREIILSFGSNELVLSIDTEHGVFDSIELIDNSFRLNYWVGDEDIEVQMCAEDLNEEDIKDIIIQLEYLYE